MTPDERAILQATGYSLLDLLGNVSIGVLFASLFIGLCVLSSLALLNRGLGRSWARWAQLIALLVTFLISVVTLVQSIAQFALQAVYLDSWPAAVNAKFESYIIALFWAQQMGILINDIVVIWRAWILYSDRPVIKLLLCIPFCATTAISFAFLVLLTKAVIATESGFGSPFGVSSQLITAYTINNVATALSLTTNLFATTLIFFQLWKHRRSFHHSGLYGNGLTSSQRIMLFLVEAGCVFCFGQVVSLILGIYLNTNTQFSFELEFALMTINDIFWSTMPMYFPVVILLVENNRAIPDSFIGADSKLFVDAADVETPASHQEGEPESSTDRSGTLQASANEDNDSH